MDNLGTEQVAKEFKHLYFYQGGQGYCVMENNKFIGSLMKSY